MRGHCVPCPLEEGETVAQVPLHNSIIGNFRDAGERRNDGGIASWPFENGTTGAEVPFHNNHWEFCFFKVTLNKFIAVIRTPIKFRMVFYNFCCYF